MIVLFKVTYWLHDAESFHPLTTRVEEFYTLEEAQKCVEQVREMMAPTLIKIERVTVETVFEFKVDDVIGAVNG